MEQVVFDNLHATAFQGTPLARSVLGPSAHVHSLQRDHLVCQRIGLQLRARSSIWRRPLLSSIEGFAFQSAIATEQITGSED